MKTPSIAELVAMDDSTLMGVLGFDTKLSSIKSDLADLATLTGKAREEAEEKIKSRLTPSIYDHDFKYIYEDAKRDAKRSGKEELDDPAPTPASVL